MQIAWVVIVTSLPRDDDDKVHHVPDIPQVGTPVQSEA